MSAKKIMYGFTFVNLLLITSVVKASVPSDWNTKFELKRPAFDPALYEDALDSEICSKQLDYLRENLLLRLQFLDAGMKLPRGITQLNFLDLGNYDQCIGIEENIGSSTIEGKYCSIQGPLINNFNKLANVMNWSDFNEEILNEGNIDLKRIQTLQNKFRIFTDSNDISRSVPDLPLPAFTLAVCVPKTCTVEEGISGLIFNLTSVGFQYKEDFCRFKNDKPWVPADYVAIVIFSLIGLLTIVSTCYDLWKIFIVKSDIKSINAVYRSFSVYTNCERLTTFSSNSSTLNSVDGIRAISMFWVVVGHTYVLLPPVINNTDVVDWMFNNLGSTWIIAAPYSVDTFFCLSGMLLVYTTVGKLSGKNLIKNLHLFYLNRLVRMFPLLAAIVLLQASLFHRIADGPNWTSVATQVELCRTYWWSTLLHVQNLVNVENQCLGHAWYLAIDVQCYIISPIVLYWLLGGKKKQAWIALSCCLLVSLTAAAVYCFVNQFQGWVIGNVREGGDPLYHLNYYFFTVPRAPPFFVGMVFGYLLNIWKGRKPDIPKAVAGLLWFLSMASMLTLTYITHLTMDPEWDLWIIDDLVNSFGRPLWAMCVGWVVFACQYGYGGPVNWFLSLDIWKLPSRISFALFLFHFKFQYILNGMSRVAEFFYSDFFALYEFFAQVTISYGVAFALTVVIDSPFSVLLKKLLSGGPKKSPVRKDTGDKNKNIYQ